MEVPVESVMFNNFNPDKIEIDDICRACLSYSDNLLSIFHNYFDDDTLVINQMLMELCSVQVIEHDGFPGQLCLDCLEEAKNAYKFKKKCEKADDTLKKYLTDSKAGVAESIAVIPKERWTDCVDNESKVNVQIKSQIEEEDASQFSNNTVFKTDADVAACDEEGCEDIQVEKVKRDSNLTNKEKDESTHDVSSNEKLVSLKKSLVSPKVKSKVGQKIKCEYCDFKTKFTRNLKRHMYKHTGDKALACDLCSYRCNEGSSMKKHKLIHTDSKPYRCTQCDFRSNSSSNLRKHERIHANEKKFVCDKCPYRTIRSASLVEHRRKHTGEKPFLCDQCHYSCGTNACLKKHVIHKHSEERKYSCDLCDYKAKTSSNLEAHKKVHSSEKPFSCEFCSYTSVQLHGLEMHKLSAHTDERPFACTICSYRTIDSHYLKVHMRTHSTIKKFECEICNYACHRKFRLKTHMKIHSGDKPFKCNICDFKSAQKHSVLRHNKRYHSLVTK